MGVSQHPSAELRADYAMGNLAPGAALAIAGHIDLCRACRLALVGLDTQAATDFDILLPAPTSPRAIPATPPAEPSAEAASPDANPQSLRGFHVRRWRRSGPGVRTGALEEAAGLGESVHMLTAEPGAVLPPGRPDLVLVLEGLLHAEAVSLEPGDFLQFTPTDSGRLRAGSTGCRCLVVGDDDLYRRSLRGWLGRLWSP